VVSAAVRNYGSVNSRSNRSVRALAAAAVLAVLLFAPCIAQAQSNAPDDGAPAAAAPAKTIRVQVLGAVERPGNIDLKDGDRLLAALARAGAAATIKSDLSRVFLMRFDPATGKAQNYMIDVYQALRHGDQRYDPILRADDKIYVTELRSTRHVPIQIAIP
jgi:protein involved in polysaccharide export with SLBB domain